MSPPESGNDKKVIETQSSDRPVLPRPEADAVKAEARQSLFLDSIDPKFRPDPATLKKDYVPPNPDGTRPRTSFGDLPASPSDSPSAGQTGNDTSKIALDGSRIPTADELAAKDRDINTYGPRPGGPDPHSKEFYMDGYRANGQALADKAADMIYPGFGRFEGKNETGSWRLDYLTGKSCHGQTLGICFKMKLK